MMFLTPSFFFFVISVLSLAVLYFIATGIDESRKQLERIADETARQRDLNRELNEEFDELHQQAKS